MAARLRHDAEFTPDKAAKARLIASAKEAEAKALQVEAAALWTTPIRRLSLRLQVTNRLRNSIRPSYRLMGFMEAETDEALDLTPA